MKDKKRVLVAMSGGVDSSVAAALLKEQGYDVIGVTMQVWDYSKSDAAIVCSPNSSVKQNLNEEGNGTCCSSLDVDDARAVCDTLGIPFYVINCEKEFKTKVIDNFIQSYLEAKTPVPCVDCNTYLKFDYLIQKMKELDCDYLATGHYAQVHRKNNQAVIVTSEDSWKDQTYFLFGIDKDILKFLLFPVGNWTKEETREYAKKNKLPVYNKKDSTGICFVGKNEYSSFIEEQLKQKKNTFPAICKGNLLSYPSGIVLGTHQGIHKFTYGQRKALGVNSKIPLYVIKIEASSGNVWLGKDKYLYHSIMKVKDFNWLSDVDLKKNLNVKIRFHHAGATGILKKQKEGWHFYFNNPQRAITPGQAAVFYQEKQLLGGAWIDQVIEQGAS